MGHKLVQSMDLVEGQAVSLETALAAGWQEDKGGGAETAKMAMVAAVRAISD